MVIRIILEAEVSGFELKKVRIMAWRTPRIWNAVADKKIGRHHLIELPATLEPECIRSFR